MIAEYKKQLLKIKSNEIPNIVYSGTINYIEIQE